MLFLRLDNVPAFFIAGFAYEAGKLNATTALAFSAGALWIAIVLAIWRPWRGVA
jgi:hypothetical protein